MKYWELLNIPGGAKTSAPPEVLDESNVALIIQAIKEQRPMEIPKDIAVTALDDSEAQAIFGGLLTLRNEFFKDIPLRQEMSKRFIFNLPKEAYQAYTKWRDYELPPCMNPLVYFYIICAEDPHYAMGRFITTILENLTDEDRKAIAKDNKEYLDDLNTQEENNT